MKGEGDCIPVHASREHLSTAEALHLPGKGRVWRSFVEEFAYISRPTATVLGPECVPIRAVGTGTALRLPTAHGTLAKFDTGFDLGYRNADGFETSPCQHEQPPETRLVEITDRVDQIAVE